MDGHGQIAVNRMALILPANVSLKLDGLRFLAALFVVAAHASQLAFNGKHQGELVALGRMGVVVFFVLSGFVIAYVCDVKHQGWRDYMVARLARLQSVFIAALLFTALADFIGRALSPEVYVGRGHPPGLDTLFKLPIFVAFLNESLSHSMRWLSNGPLWSIAYEFWYYLIFGAAYYLRGVRRLAWLAALCWIAGPRILLLFPLWLTGVALYHARPMLSSLPTALSICSLLAGLSGLAWLCDYSNWLALAPARQWGEHIVGRNYSSFFVWDGLLLIPACLLMVGVIHPAILKIPPIVGEAVRYLAGATFTVYCFHVPLLLLARATGAYDPGSLVQSAASAGVVVGFCLLASHASERRKKPWAVFWTKIIRP
jgi:peptidoglycan/LPS O-acetylase OafA/YrhL